MPRKGLGLPFDDSTQETIMSFDLGNLLQQYLGGANPNVNPAQRTISTKGRKACRAPPSRRA